MVTGTLCASVVAKVVRDRMMARLAARYPGYGWEHNQGYATREHRAAVRSLGLTPFHRRSFLALQRTLAGDQVSLDLFGEGDREAPDDAPPPHAPLPERADGKRLVAVGPGLDDDTVGATEIEDWEAAVKDAGPDFDRADGAAAGG